MDKKADFFVSYTGADAAWAEWIAWILEEHGYPVIMQKWDFVNGCFVNHIGHALDLADQIMMVLSPAYLESGFTESEWKAFYADVPRGDTIKIARISPAEQPKQIASVLHIDLFDPASGLPLSEPKSEESLVSYVRGKRLKPATRPTYPSGSRPIYPASTLPSSRPIPVLPTASVQKILPRIRVTIAKELSTTLLPWSSPSVDVYYPADQSVKSFIDGLPGKLRGKFRGVPIDYGKTWVLYVRTYSFRESGRLNRLIGESDLGQPARVLLDGAGYLLIGLPDQQL